MDLSFDDRVAVVTGAGGGLGRAHALELGRRGAKVVVNDMGTSLSGDGVERDRAAIVVKEIEALGGTAVADTNSIATEEGGRSVIETAVAAFGRVDIVVNNAGILRDKTFHNTGPDDVDPVLDVHLKGAFNVTRPAWSLFRDQGFGRVVVTSSSAGFFGNFGQASYASAKLGLVGLIKVLAIEGRKYNITANAIGPVAMTRMTSGFDNPLADYLDPALVSSAVAFLCHESCELSGEVLSAGGGRVARVFIGVTRGYLKGDLTAEDIRDHLDEVFDDTGYQVPGNSMEEMNLLASMLGK
ncbi:SDR family NAD(P)-dependent oxidoreductase [Nonomuraea glycinis]|uniref:SDR family NAD(P)-dependent oxidoreductase n=1 Tax=Nonomuraea glycinis TaxID=2047744 RepID=UPI002E0E0096|nr:SDR family NAD(P)-dependent oxidoreductase [Nonomuraea glycinis]